MKKLFIISLLLVVLFGCSSATKDLQGEGKTAKERCQEAFDGLKTNNEEGLKLLSFSGIDENAKFFLSIEQGAKLRSYMTYKITSSKESSNENDPVYEITVSIKSIDLLKVTEEYEKLSEGSNSGFMKKTLLQAIDNCKNEKIKTEVQIKAILNSDIDVWRIIIDEQVFNALFPNYDKYLEWLN